MSPSAPMPEHREVEQPAVQAVTHAREVFSVWGRDNFGWHRVMRMKDCADEFPTLGEARRMAGRCHSKYHDVEIHRGRNRQEALTLEERYPRRDCV